MKRSIYIIGFAFFVTFISSISWAQDPHLTQYDASPMIVNPANTGMLPPSSFRAATQYRNQWGMLGTRFTTTSIGFDAPVDRQIGAGVYITDDNAAKTYNTFSLVLSGAYEITSPTNRDYKLSVGLQAGFIYKKTNEAKLTFDNQYTSGVFNPDYPSGEAFPKLSKMMPEFNVGFSYVDTKNNKTFNPYGGFAVFHASHPKESFYGEANEESRLPLRWLIHGGTKINLNKEFKLNPNLLAMKQGTSYEIIGAIDGSYNISSSFDLAAGFGYRWKDAIFALLGFNYDNYIFRISYDFTVSDLRKYTRGFGGLEFSLIYMASSSRGRLSRY
ncbi:MAG: hypothetical protein C0594_01730 [Marinilabiliales bacterium]|nr:MAG: hypothetical protein C0594_01730 [Marinilabiliales bacterium]